LFLLGIVFAAGWTLCIGTILGAILTLGFSQETTGQAMVLTSGYTLGLGIPFLILSVLLERAFTPLRWLRHYTRPIQILSGLLLVAMGVLVLTNQMFYLAIWAQRNGLYLDPNWATRQHQRICWQSWRACCHFCRPVCCPSCPPILSM
jgi:cytochrome c-type biogenesis protein